MDASDSKSMADLVEWFAPGATLLECRPLTGGVSAQTTALTARHRDGHIERFVVRVRGPRDVARDPEIAVHEFQLLKVLRESGLPVPRPVYAHRAGAIFDGPAIVMEYVEGEIITKPADPSAFVNDLAYWLSRIHALDPSILDQSFLTGQDESFDDELSLHGDDSPITRMILDALELRWPVEPRNNPVLLHGDFWRGNLLWKDGTLVAIIDWEDAAIGDPLADLARTRMEIHWTHGAKVRERFTARYVFHRNIDVEYLANWDLARALPISRAIPTWNLPAARERHLQCELTGFVQNAIRQLAERPSQP